MSRRILITGASGFLGSVLARLLAQRTGELRCLVRPKGRSPNLDGIEYERAEGELGDEASLRRALEGVDQVLHCAAIVSFDQKDRRVIHETNVRGTARLARLAREAGGVRFLHVSSVVALGRSTDGEALREDSGKRAVPLRNPYCVSKRKAEQAVLAEVEEGLDAVIVQPSQILGPGDSRGLSNSLLRQVALRQIPFLPPGASNVVDVRDVASGCLLALEHGKTGERYILGGQNLRNRDLILRIASIAGCPAPSQSVPASAVRLLAFATRIREALTRRPTPLSPQLLRLSTLQLVYSSEKAEAELGYAPYPIDMAIKDAFDWMLDNEELPAEALRALGRT